MDHDCRKNLIIIGAGDFGREVFAWAEQAVLNGAPWKIKGFLDARKHKLDGFCGYPPILASSDTYRIEDDDVFVGASGDPKDKLKFYSPIVEQGGPFVTRNSPPGEHWEECGVGDGDCNGSLFMPELRCQGRQSRGSWRFQQCRT